MANQIALKARDIDVCMFNIIDGTLEKELLLDCLMFYQNNDGGFKGGLYIDNYNINSIHKYVESKENEMNQIENMPFYGNYKIIVQYLIAQSGWFCEGGELGGEEAVEGALAGVAAEEIGDGGARLAYGG